MPEDIPDHGKKTEKKAKRVSHLVDLFERQQSESLSKKPSGSRKQTETTQKRSSLPTGAVQSGVKRYSSAASSSQPQEAVASGKLSDLDWSPKPPPSFKARQSIPAKPPIEPIDATPKEPVNISKPIEITRNFRPLRQAPAPPTALASPSNPIKPVEPAKGIVIPISPSLAKKESPRKLDSLSTPTSLQTTSHSVETEDSKPPVSKALESLVSLSEKHKIETPPESSKEPSLLLQILSRTHVEESPFADPKNPFEDQQSPKVQEDLEEIPATSDVPLLQRQEEPPEYDYNSFETRLVAQESTDELWQTQSMAHTLVGDVDFKDTEKAQEYEEGDIGKAFNHQPREQLCSKDEGKAFDTDPEYPSVIYAKSLKAGESYFLASRSNKNPVQNLPAANLFARHSLPLHLPMLDCYLADMRMPKFSEPEEILSQKEMERWKKWVRGTKDGFWKGLWKNITRDSDTRKGRGSYFDLEQNQESSTGFESLVGGYRSLTRQQERSLVFPPVELLPEQLKVRDLKNNRHSASPMVTLQSALGSTINGIIGLEGSTVGINMMTLEGWRDLFQMITLLVSSSSSSILASKTSTGAAAASEQSALYTLTSILALDFVSAFGRALLWFWILNFLALMACFEIWLFTGGRTFKEPSTAEGLDTEGDNRPTGIIQRIRRSRGWRMGITFFATSVYLPLSKLSIGGLFWTSDYWAVKFPDGYPNANGTVAALGPKSEFYSTMDFCYRTTMKRPDGIKNFNWGYVVVVFGACTVCWLTIWLPIRLYRVVQRTAPRVDKYTELGEKRTDLNGEYARLLDIDKSPFSFLYQDYRRKWVGFKSIYMGIKLVNVLLIVILSSDNCAFRSQSAIKMNIIRQAALLVWMCAFLATSWYSRAFLDYLSNNSDRIARICFVFITLIGLLVALEIPDYDIFNGPILIIIQVISYTTSVYFTMIGANWCQRLVKKIQHRIDFSIDIFSPHLDMPKHIARRIWQEAISTIMLAGPEFKIKHEESPVFSRDPSLPIAPQLLNFKGSQAERYIENLKILRTVGLEEYWKALHCQFSKETQEVYETIQRDWTGPDVVWNGSTLTCHPSRQRFGRLDIVPFPFACIFRPDDKPLEVEIIKDLSDLKSLIEQNEIEEVKTRRRVRLTLRAMEGQEIFIPYSDVKHVGTSGSDHLDVQVNYFTARLFIERNSTAHWRGYCYSSGFKIKVKYVDGTGFDVAGNEVKNKEMVVDGEDVGISSNFELTPAVSRLIQTNREIIAARLPDIEIRLGAHRRYFSDLSKWKKDTLSYGFLFNIVGEVDFTMESLDQTLRKTEHTQDVRFMAQLYHGSLAYTLQQIDVVGQDRVRSFWFILWSDIWYKNSGTVSRLKNDPTSFSPRYRSSICWTPMPRARLEEFLSERGLWFAPGKGKAFFHNGLLNRIYFVIDEIIYRNTPYAIPLHLKSSTTREPIPYDQLSYKLFRSGRDVYEMMEHPHDRTGDGTDEADSVIRFRDAYSWEDITNSPRAMWGPGTRKAWFKDVLTKRIPLELRTYFGLSPIRHTSRPGGGQDYVVFELRLGENNGCWELPEKNL